MAGEIIISINDNTLRLPQETTRRASRPGAEAVLLGIHDPLVHIVWPQRVVAPPWGID